MKLENVFLSNNCQIILKLLIFFTVNEVLKNKTRTKEFYIHVLNSIHRSLGLYRIIKQDQEIRFKYDEENNELKRIKHGLTLLC
jgi:hypothetical protein